MLALRGRAAWFAAFLVLVAMLVMGPGLARAVQSVPILDGPVTDETGEVDEDAAETALARLADERGYDLWALFVETTGSTRISEYTDEVVAANNLGGSDALLVVALDDRTYQLWLGDLLIDEVTQSEQDRILADEVEPALQDGDYGAAIAGAADGLRAASSPAGDPPGGDAGEPQGVSDGGSSIGGIILLVILGLIVVGVVALILSRKFAGSRSRKTGAGHGAAGATAPEAARAMSLEELAQRANTLLLELDEGTREAEQELGFAEAQFTVAEVAGFRAALDDAKGRLSRAFTLRQELEDSVPDTKDRIREVLTQIVQECEAAQAGLAEQMRLVASLRDLERNAGPMLTALAGEVAALEARLPASGLAMSDLQTQAESAWRPVEGNLEETRKRISAAREAIGRGQAVVATDAGAAVAEVRAAQRAVAEGRGLLDAVDHLAAELVEARTHLAERLRAATQSLRQASAAASKSRERSAQLQEAEQRLAEARSQLTARPPDLVSALQLVRHVDAAANDLKASLQADADRARKEAEALDEEIRAAAVSRQRASDYVNSRRGSVGSAARTRLSEAERHLELARSKREGGGVTAALTDARRARNLADEAYRLALSDFQERKTYGGTSSSADMSVLAGIFMGGLGSMLGDAARQSGRRSSGSGRFGGFGGGGSRGGGGGSRGGGGGRSRGGRW
ncbi:MAG: TPM domain-containing protein [Dehalococcoidia bacterium]|nr:TPM domain-containing protein [Dehalococcoidia bacterium]